MASTLIGVSLDFFIGIDSDGNLNLGNLLLDIVSLFSGAGLFARIGGKIITKIPTFLLFLKENKWITKILNIWPKFDAFISMVSSGLSFFTNPFKKIFSGIFKRGFIERFEDSNFVLSFSGHSFKLSNFIKGLNVYLYNPIRNIYNILFPNVDKIKKNIGDFVNFLTNPPKISFNMHSLGMKNTNDILKKLHDPSHSMIKVFGPIIENGIKQIKKPAKTIF